MTSNTSDADRDGALLLVIPAVIEQVEGRIRIDGDFSNNLRAYLQHFDEVCVMCPPLGPGYRFPNTCEVDEVAGYEHLRIVVLPSPYREDRYIFQKSSVKRILKQELVRADYRLISPHAGLDWSTVAAEICIDIGLPYNIEADWNIPDVMRFEWSKMTWGPNKLRKLLLLSHYNRRYKRVLRNSSLALLQGGDVYHDFANIAPNAHSVLNVQVTSDEHISPSSLRAKIAQIGTRPLRICYTGRATEIKGPLLWLDVVTRLRDSGCRFQATWAGDGDLLEDMKQVVAVRRLADVCDLVGALPRQEARELVKSSDVFMFCHMAKESPRCLVEALAFGTPIIGFGSDYSRELVASAGGGRFVARGDVTGLAEQVRSLSEKPQMLRELVAGAAASGALLERESAITRRIRLMKEHLSPNLGTTSGRKKSSL